MNLLDHIDRLRKEPEPKRRKAVLLISAGITIAIVVVWGAFFAMSLSSADFTFVSPSPGESVPSLSDTFSSVFQKIGGIFSNAQKTFRELPSAATDTPR